MPLGFVPSTVTPLTLGTTLTKGRIKRPPHLAYLETILLEMVAGLHQRVIVTMPPRHGKSDLCSHWFPTWLLGHFPDERIILASYEANFAASWGRKVRDSLDAAKEAGLFHHGVRRDVSSASEWQVEGRGGGMLTAGVGGGVTGKGGNIILDDPVKNAEEAASRVYREKTWEWWNSTMYTRLEPGAWALVIQTRWHGDDLTGRLLERSSEPWLVVNFPALAETQDVLGRQVNEALWPQRYPVVALENIKRQLGSYWWSALYQQHPSPREGGFFQRSWFGILPVPPAEVKRRVRFWDKAATEGGGDWTRGVLMSATPEGLYVVEDVQSIQGSSGRVKELIKATALRDGPGVHIRMEQEPGSSGKDVIADYTRTLAGYNFKGVPATGNKEVRADPVSSQAEAGNVKLVVGPWNEAYLEEMAAFPHGMYDDQVDATSGAFSELASAPVTFRARLVTARTSAGEAVPSISVAERPPICDALGNVIEETDLHRLMQQAHRRAATRGR